MAFSTKNKKMKPYAMTLSMVYFSTNPETPSCILSPNLWFNKFITVDNFYVNFTNFSTLEYRLREWLSKWKCNFKSWENFKKRLYTKNYILPRVVTINSFQRNFQNKIFHNILYLSKMLFTFGKTKTPCNETMKHIF